ncbi:MAG: SRPBCC domain-containing protein [Chloroflexota bacterium]|nr:SRPBCC domain-containing protein [Chloroflexota bacterium]
MELSDEFSVSAPPSEVWRLFWDLPRVARCLPGCESITSTGPDAYRARVAQRVGPFKVAFDLDLAVQEAVEMERVVVSGGGQDRMGNRLKLNRLSLELEEAPGGGTLVKYGLDFALTGRMATLGNSAVKRKAEETRREFSERIAAELDVE